MGGGVSPLEWIYPPVALAHTAYNAAAQQIDPRAKIDMPASKNDIRDDKMDDQQKQAQAAQQAEQERIALIPRPQTGQEEQASRQRAQMASDILGGGRRRKASQTLTASDYTLSGQPREAM